MLPKRGNFLLSLRQAGKLANSRVLVSISLLLSLSMSAAPVSNHRDAALASLKKGQQVANFRVSNLYSDSDERVVGAKFFHVPSGAPIFLLQIETVPQAFVWVDSAVNSDRGLPHALEHLLAEKGTKGRYVFLLTDMEMSRSAAVTWRDFTFYSFSSGAGIDGFFDLLHGWLDALYHPDFSDVEAEREFFHFGVDTDASTKTRTLTEGGTVYNEEEAIQRDENCYRDLQQRVLGKENPLAARITGDPDQMRDVTPQEIREFHRAHYHLGPTTSFIFVIPPKENVASFLSRVSSEFEKVGESGTRKPPFGNAPGDPKYPVHSSPDHQPQICPVPGANESAPSSIWFSWRPQTFHSMIDFKLLQLLFRALADGQRSLLYRSLVDSKTREIDTGAADVALDPFPPDSPQFQVWNIAVSGIAGTRISLDEITQLRNKILEKIKEISEYPDHSEKLAGFNNLVSYYAQDWRRSKHVWMRNSPQFGSVVDVDWKDFLGYLEMDSSFVRSMSEERLWQQLDNELKSGRNIWRDLIRVFNLLDPPYALATQPSRELLQKQEEEKRERLANELTSIRKHYQVSTDQEALVQFERDELAKTKEIEEVESRVPKPRFPEHPPLSLDDDIQYKQFQVSGVPATASVFDRPATIELGLSFDLRQIPRKYYKYLPILARSFDSLGLKEGGNITSHSELLNQTRSRFVEFGAGTSDNPVSHRADLTFRMSATNVSEFNEGLEWLARILRSSYLDPGNAARLRDIVTQRLAADDSYTKQSELAWVFHPAQAFRYQADTLYLALESQFTKAHWDGRLRWLLHDQVASEEIDHLGAFAETSLAGFQGLSRSDISQRLAKLNAKGVDGELIDHWKRNLNSFPEDKVVDGLKRLTGEVQEDLRTGPAITINEVKELQRLVVNRRALHLDLLVSPSILDSIHPNLARFVISIPSLPPPTPEDDPPAALHPIGDKVARENGLAEQQFPWYLGLVIPDELIGNASFYSDFVTYSQADTNSLLRLLSSGLLAGRGPTSAYMKSREAGLAYALFLRGDPSRGLILYYADRSSDVPSLISSMNSAADNIHQVQDPYMVDYALRQTFPMLPRSSNTFSLRARWLAQDIRDGNTPEKVRAFYQALLNLRRDPNLLSELTGAGKGSLCGVLLEEGCKVQQASNNSVFFFVGSEQILADAEKRLPISRLLRIWPSDYWLP